MLGARTHESHAAVMPGTRTHECQNLQLYKYYFLIIYIYLEFYNYTIIDHNFNSWNTHIKTFTLCIKRYNVFYTNGFTNGKAFEGFEKFNRIGIRKQFPLCLSYGITVHKSHGLSLKHAVIRCWHFDFYHWPNLYCSISTNFIKVIVLKGRFSWIRPKIKQNLRIFFGKMKRHTNFCF